MLRSDASSSEPERLQALRAYEVLDTPPEDAFDQIAQLAAQLCGASVAVISFVDAQRQWIKASIGIDVCDQYQENTLCELVLQQGDQPLWVPDAVQHPLFATHPMVRGAPYVRFYACIPLVNDQGFLLGTLAVMDRQAHTLAPEQWSALHSLAHQTMAQLELRRQTRVLSELVQDHAKVQASLQTQTEKLLLSEERLHLGARATAHALWDWDLRSQTLWRNEDLESLVGIAQSEVSQGPASWADRIHPDECEAVLASVHDSIQSHDDMWSSQYRFRGVDGSYMWVQDRGFIIRNAQGEALRMVGGMSDLRAQKQIEAYAMEEAKVHSEIVEIQHEMSSIALDLPQVLALVAQAALRSHQSGGAMVELLEGDQLVLHAAAGPMAIPSGTALPVDRSMVWPSLQQGRTVLCNDTVAEGWDVSHGRERMRAVVAVPLRVQRTVIGMLSVVASQCNAFTKHDVAHLQVLAESLGSMVQMRKITAQLQASERQYKLLFEAHPQPMWVYAQGDNQRILAVNEAMLALYGYSEAEALQLHLHDLHGDDAATSPSAAAPSACEDPQCTDALRQHRCKDGTPIEVKVSVRSMLFDTRMACQVMVVDVTEQRQTERELARMDRAQKLLRACSETLVRATSERSMLKDVCAIAVDIGGYRMGWVGLAHGDAEKSIEPIAHTGPYEKYLQDLNLSWSVTSPNGHRPAGMAVRTGQSVIFPGSHSDLEAADWKERMHAHGFQGAICLPLRHQDATLGVLCLYTSEVRPFSTEESHLLQELANDLAFGMLRMRNRDEQQRLHASVVKVAAAVSATSGTEFFVGLTHNMAEALDAQVACMALFSPLKDDGMASAKSLAVVINGALQPNTTYDLEGTPSLQLLSQSQVLIERDVALRYPKAPVVHTVGAQSYAGQQLCDASGKPIGMICVLFRQPVTNAEFVTSALQIFAARASAEMQRQLADTRIHYLASLLDKAQDAIIVRDLNHRILFWNHGAERMYGWSSAEALGQSCVELLYNDPLGCQLATTFVLEQGEWVGELVQKHRDGHTLEMEGRWTLVRGEDGQPESILTINTDISARKATEREIQRLAFYDSLTGLPNRVLLMDRMRQALAASQRTQNGGALLFIDMDNFKTLNDTLGHDKGDQMLQQVGQRLKNCVRDIDTVARLGGDEFVVMLEALSPHPEELAMQARSVGEKILISLSAGYQLGAYLYRSTPSIGVAPFQGDRQNVGDILQQADMAMYQAKSAGRNTLRFFNPQMQSLVTARAELESDLRSALAQNQFLLHYQPQIDLLGQFTGVEALVRWQHPERGMVSPAQFIPLAEETGLILMLGRWVLHNACELLASWQNDPALGHLTMAVNVSSRQFRNPGFVLEVARVLAITQAPPHLLKLELTESVLVEDMDTTIATMTALRDQGVGFSLDDFGTGYSSLSYLKRMPLNQLKIDQSFVRDLLTDPSDAVIVKTIIALGQSLGLDVIAEGVETVEQHATLLQAGCRAFQGYLFSRPVPQDQLELLLRQDPFAPVALAAPEPL